MKRISKPTTWFEKNVWTPFWLALLALVVLSVAAHTIIERKNFVFLIVAIFGAATAFVLVKKHVWGLVDAVYDCGDSLLVKDDGKQYRVPLAAISNINWSFYGRITLRISRDISKEALPSEVSFVAGWSSSQMLGVSGPRPLVENLLAREEQARARETRGRAMHRVS
jgi:hypothetical protein